MTAFCPIANKISYETKVEANTQAQRRRGKARQRLFIYWCHHCNGHHLTRTRGQSKPQRFNVKLERVPCVECDRRAECVRAEFCLEPNQELEGEAS